MIKTGGVALQPIAENSIVTLYGRYYYASEMIPRKERFECDLFELEGKPVIAAREKKNGDAVWSTL